MRRRKFITLLGGAAAAWPIVGGAQQPAMPVIGYLSLRSHNAERPLLVPFLQSLEKSGFADGRNIAIEYRFADGREARLLNLAAELLNRQVSLLVALGRQTALAAKTATSIVPIVFGTGFDPVLDGTKSCLAAVAG
jgi:putative ABC transport system substrate-binding protein